MMNEATLEEIRQKLNHENMLPNCTQAQKESNAWTLHLYELLSRGKAPYEPSPASDTILEWLTRGERCTPNSLLKN